MSLKLSRPKNFVANAMQGEVIIPTPINQKIEHSKSGVLDANESKVVITCS